MSAGLHIQWLYGSYCNEAGRSTRPGSIRIHFMRQMLSTYSCYQNKHDIYVKCEQLKNQQKGMIFIFYHIPMSCLFSMWMTLYSQLSSLHSLKITPWLMRTMSFTSALEQLILCTGKMVCRAGGTKAEKTLLQKALIWGFCFYVSERLWYSTSFLSPSGVLWKAAEGGMEVGELSHKLCS